MYNTQLHSTMPAGADTQVPPPALSSINVAPVARPRKRAGRRPKTFRCTFCSQVFGRAEHLRRHEMSRALKLPAGSRPGAG